MHTAIVEVARYLAQAPYGHVLLERCDIPFDQILLIDPPAEMNSLVFASL